MKKAVKRYLPTAKEMSDFAKSFALEDWQYLCCYDGFVEMVAEDIETARMLAKKILADTAAEIPIY